MAWGRSAAGQGLPGQARPTHQQRPRAASPRVAGWQAWAAGWRGRSGRRRRAPAAGGAVCVGVCGGVGWGWGEGRRAGGAGKRRSRGRTAFRRHTPSPAARWPVVPCAQPPHMQPPHHFTLPPLAPQPSPLFRPRRTPSAVTPCARRPRTCMPPARRSPSWTRCRCACRQSQCPPDRGTAPAPPDCTASLQAGGAERAGGGEGSARGLGEAAQAACAAQRWSSSEAQRSAPVNR